MAPVLDLKSSNYQNEMDEADKTTTAFVTVLEFWDFNHMPQGVTNAPNTVQRLRGRIKSKCSSCFSG